MSHMFAKQNLEGRDYFNKDISLKERISKLIRDLESFNPYDGLNKVVETIKGECFLLTKAYKDISEEIRESLYQVLTEINDKKVEALKIDVKLNQKQGQLNRYCALYSKLPPVFDEKGSADYKMFLESYERGTYLSQCISNLNLEAVDLLDIQKILDLSFSSGIIELESLSSRLHELINKFGSIRTPEISSFFENKFSYLKDLKAMVSEKEREFEDIQKHLESAKADTPVLDKYDKFAERCLSEGISTGISKDLFAYKK